MTKPQQPEVRRSENTPMLAPDAMVANLDARDQPGSNGAPPNVPQANKPGTPSGPVQDKPDMDKFIARASGEDPISTASTSDDESLVAKAGKAIAPRAIRVVAMSAAGAAVAAKAVTVVLRRKRAAAEPDNPAQALWRRVSGGARSVQQAATS